MNHLYPLIWYSLGVVTYHYLGVYGRARKKLFQGGEIDLLRPKV